MKPTLGRKYSVSAHCPACEAITSFDQKSVGIIEYPGGDTHTKATIIFECYLYLVNAHDAGQAVSPQFRIMGMLKPCLSG
jgi:hypothetical protein